MEPPCGTLFPYHSHIFRDLNMGVGLGNSMGPENSTVDIGRKDHIFG